MNFGEILLCVVKVNTKTVNYDAIIFTWLYMLTHSFYILHVIDSSLTGHDCARLLKRLQTENDFSSTNQ